MKKKVMNKIVRNLSSFRTLKRETEQVAEKNEIINSPQWISDNLTKRRSCQTRSKPS